MYERLDQFSDMLHYGLEFTQNNSHHSSPYENRLLGYDDRMNMTRGISIEFFHFDGTNPVGWVFKASQFFDFH